MRILIVTTGGTIDKAYFGALSQYQVTEALVAWLLAVSRVPLCVPILELMQKDSLDLTNEDRRRIVDAVSATPAKRISVTHDTDRRVETAWALAQVEQKTIALVGALAPAQFAESDAQFNLATAFAKAHIASPG